MKILILASHNQHKVNEINEMIKHLDIVVKSLKDLNYHKDIIEDGLTLEENAVIKANVIYNQFQEMTIGEDTGLEVAALDNRPGVYTARYGGPERDAGQNMSKLLHELNGKENRKARFRTSICLISDGKTHLIEGIVNGSIALHISGKGGFGYDPVFIPDGYEKTFAELPPEVKNEISHRGRAITKLIDFLKKNF